MGESKKRSRRRVVVFSAADQELLAQGQVVAWDAVSVREISLEPESEVQLSPREREIVAEVPPHY